MGTLSYDECLKLVGNFMRLPLFGLQMRKKRAGLKPSNNCFRGSDAIDQMVRSFNFNSRNDAIDIGQKLMCADLIRANPNMHGKITEFYFKDDQSWYYFTDFDQQEELFIRAHAASAAYIVLSAPKPKVEVDESIASQTASSSSSSKLALDMTTLQRQQSASALERMTSPKRSSVGLPTVEDFGDFDEDSDDIKFSTSDKSSAYPRVKAATVEKLIFRLTHEKYPDVKFRDTFLLTYRSFMTPGSLLSQLIARWNIDDDPLDPNVKKTIQLRVLSVVKSWVESHCEDFKQDEELKLALLDFIDGPMASMAAPAEQLKKTLLRQLEKKKEIISNQVAKPTEPILPNKLEAGKFTFDDLSEIELARQISLLESRIYSGIETSEFLNLSWSRKEKERNSPHILEIVDQFNRTSRWAASQIVHKLQLKQRVSALERLIKLAEELMKLNNYNGVMEILSGINSSPVRRLKKTWEELTPLWKGRFQRLEEMMSHEQNYKTYRAALHNCDPPTIPYLGVYLTDLTFIEEGNKNILERGLVNFDKCYLTAAVIGEIQQYQRIGYSHITVVREIQEWLRVIDGGAEEELYEWSMKVEPRKEWEALENMLMEEERLRKELQYAQLRIADLEANNKRMTEHLESLTAELRKWRRISGRPPTEYHASKPGGAGGWLGYTPAESGNRLLSPESAITRLPSAQPVRALPTAPVAIATLAVPVAAASSSSSSPLSTLGGGGMTACPPERPPRPTRAEPVPVRVVETEVPRPQHRSAARPRSPGTRRANVPTVLAPHSPLQIQHHQQQHSPHHQPPQQQQQQQYQPQQQVHHQAPSQQASSVHSGVPQQQVPSAASTGAPRPMRAGPTPGGPSSPNHDAGVPPMARRMSVGRGAPPGAGGPGRGRGGPGRGAPGTPGARRPPPAAGIGRGIRPHSDDGRTSVVMSESISSGAAANQSPEARLAELRDRMRACTLKRPTPGPPNSRTASVSMSPARIRPNV